MTEDEMDRLAEKIAAAVSRQPSVVNVHVAGVVSDKGALAKSITDTFHEAVRRGLITESALAS